MILKQNLQKKSDLQRKYYISKSRKSSYHPHPPTIKLNLSFLFHQKVGSEPKKKDEHIFHLSTASFHYRNLPPPNCESESWTHRPPARYRPESNYRIISCQSLHGTFCPSVALHDSTTMMVHFGQPPHRKSCFFGSLSRHVTKCNTCLHKSDLVPGGNWRVFFCRLFLII